MLSLSTAGLTTADSCSNEITLFDTEPMFINYWFHKYYMDMAENTGYYQMIESLVDRFRSFPSIYFDNGTDINTQANCITSEYNGIIRDSHYASEDCKH